MLYDISSLHNLFIMHIFASSCCCFKSYIYTHLMMQKHILSNFYSLLNSTQRTVINYQYRYGSTFLQALTTLYGMGKSTNISSLLLHSDVLHIANIYHISKIHLRYIIVHHMYQNERWHPSSLLGHIIRFNPSTNISFHINGRQRWC